MQASQLLLDRRLHWLTRTPAEKILPLGAPPPFRRDGIQAALDIVIVVVVVVAIAALAGTPIELQFLQVHLVEPEVARREGRHGGRKIGGPEPLGRHLLPRLVVMPLLALRLPPDQGVGIAHDHGLVDGAGRDGLAHEPVHVEPDAARRPVAQEGQDALDPAHELVEEAVVVAVDLVHELVEGVLVSGAQVDERLHRLVRVGADVLALRGFDDSHGVIGEGGEVGDGAVDVGGFVHAHEGLVEDGEEVAEELEGGGLEGGMD